MKRETLIWLIVLGIGVALLAVKMTMPAGVGRQYIREVEKSYVQVERPIDGCEGLSQRVWVPANDPALQKPGLTPTGQQRDWKVYEPALQQDLKANEPGVRFSMRRTLGTWFAAFLTLSIFSFLYRDNPFYKLAESIFIGVSAAYWMVVQFWSVIIPNLLGNLIPDAIRATAMPGLETTEIHLVYLVPLALAVMLLWRLMPAGGWISRWPLAFFIGVFAGLRMIQFIQADFLNQIRNGILPLVTRDDAGLNWTEMIWNWTSVVGVLACLTYFFFSIEHKGAVGRVARLGTWILMVTFGAMFAFTVMGRIALLTGRLEFLFIDWLRLIDPTGTRTAEAAVALVTTMSPALLMLA
jgi:hypothetical protein